MIQLQPKISKRIYLALKDDLKEIKQELNTQEQFLESAIRTERFFKKYKNIFIAVVIIFVAWIGFSYFNDYLTQQTLNKANNAYNILQKDSTNQEAIAELKDAAPSLLAIIKFKQLSKNSDTNAIKELAKSDIDPILSEIFLASINEGKQAILEEYNMALDGYKLLKNGDIKQADEIFNKISPNSAVFNLIQNIKHYQDIK